MTPHQNILSQTRHCFDDAEPFKLEGVYCKLIPLNKGLYSIVWASDYEWLMQWKWYAVWSNRSLRYYANRNVRKDDPKGTSKTLNMHRQIMGMILASDPRRVDHRNREDTLDNRRSNLREATPRQNMWNKKRYSNNRSGFKGVGYHKYTTGPKKWVARIRINGTLNSLGYYLTPEEAFEKYKAAAVRYFGEFARFE
jgi:hypothetical protein